MDDDGKESVGLPTLAIDHKREHGHADACSNKEPNKGQDDVDADHAGPAVCNPGPPVSRPRLARPSICSGRLKAGKSEAEGYLETEHPAVLLDAE
jgi:hypothetical protein